MSKSRARRLEELRQKIHNHITDNELSVVLDSRGELYHDEKGRFSYVDDKGASFYFKIIEGGFDDLVAVRFGDLEFDFVKTNVDQIGDYFDILNGVEVFDVRQAALDSVVRGDYRQEGSGALGSSTQEYSSALEFKPIVASAPSKRQEDGGHDRARDLSSRPRVRKDEPRTGAVSAAASASVTVARPARHASDPVVQQDRATAERKAQDPLSALNRKAPPPPLRASLPQQDYAPSPQLSPAISRARKDERKDPPLPPASSRTRGLEESLASLSVATSRLASAAATATRAEPFGRSNAASRLKSFVPELSQHPQSFLVEDEEESFQLPTFRPQRAAAWPSELAVSLPVALARPEPAARRQTVSGGAPQAAFSGRVSPALLSRGPVLPLGNGEDVNLPELSFGYEGQIGQPSASRGASALARETVAAARPQAIPPQDPMRTQVALKFISEIKRSGANTIIFDCDHTLISEHTWNGGMRIKQPITKKELRDKGFTKEKFADLELLKIILAEAKNQGVDCYVSSRQFRQNVRSIMEIGGIESEFKGIFGGDDLAGNENPKDVKDVNVNLGSKGDVIAKMSPRQDGKPIKAFLFDDSCTREMDDINKKGQALNFVDIMQDKGVQSGLDSMSDRSNRFNGMSCERVSMVADRMSEALSSSRGVSAQQGASGFSPLNAQALSGANVPDTGRNN